MPQRYQVSFVFLVHHHSKHGLVALIAIWCQVDTIMIPIGPSSFSHWFARRRYLISLLCILFVICGCRGYRSTPCELPTGLHSLSTISECFETIPSSPIDRRQIFDVLGNASQLYAYRDLAPVDLLSAVQQLADLDNSHWEYEYQFYSSILSLVISLRDVNTQYTAPSIYSTVFQVRPFTVIRNADTKHFYLGGNPAVDLDEAQQFVEPSVNLTELLGARILAVNGSSPENWLERGIQQFGRFRDLSASYNDALLSSNGFFTMASAAYFPLQLTSAQVDQFKLQLSNGTVISASVPLLALVTNSSDSNSVNRDALAFDIMSCQEASNISFGLLRMPPSAFSVPLNSDFQWARTVSDFIAAASKLPSKSLIIDLSAENHSGMPERDAPHCLARWLTQALIPPWRNCPSTCSNFSNCCSQSLWGFAKSQSTDMLIQDSVPPGMAALRPQSWTDTSSGSQLSTLRGWYTPGRILTSASGARSSYTEPEFWRGSCSDTLDRLVGALPEDSVSLERILLLSDGRLSGASAVFADTLRRQNRVRILAFGGAAKTDTSDIPPMDYAANVGGITPFNWPSDVQAPVLLPVLAPHLGSLQITFTSYFSSNLSHPREFQFLPADFRAAQWPRTAADRKQLFCQAAITLFSGKMPSGLPNQPVEIQQGPLIVTPLIIAVIVIVSLFALALISAILLAIYRRLTFNYQALE